MKKAVIILALLIILTACSSTNLSDSDKSSSAATPETTSVTEIEMQSLLIYSVKIENNKDVITQRPFEVPNSETLQNKLQLIADEISNDYFNGLEIKVSKIEDNTAYINLLDMDSTSWKTGWMQRFQGSAGANNTAVVLFENFFQKQLSSDWIDALQLLHNGEKMEETDHFIEVGIVRKDSDFPFLNDYATEQPGSPA